MNPRIVNPVTVLTDTFQRPFTVEPVIGQPDLGLPWTVYGLNFGEPTYGRIWGGHVETSLNRQAGQVWLTQRLSRTPYSMTATVKWWTTAGAGAEGYFGLCSAAGVGTTRFDNFVYVQVTRTLVKVWKKVGATWTAMATENLPSTLTADATHTVEVRWLPWSNTVEVYIDGTLRLTHSSGEYPALMGPWVGWQMAYDDASNDSSKVVTFEAVGATQPFGPANAAPAWRRLPAAPEGQRDILWDITLGPAGTGWHHMMCVVDGDVYGVNTNGLCYRVDALTGHVRATCESVGHMTVPEVIGDYVWVAKPVGGDILLTKLNRSDLSISYPQYTITGGVYSEQMPYDPVTGYFFIRRKVGGVHKVSAINSANGSVVWTCAENLGADSLINWGAPLVVGNYVIVQSYNGTSNYLWKFACATGALQSGWPTAALGAGAATEYNNPIYDAVNDRIYGSTRNAVVYCVNNATGAVVWTVDLAGSGYSSWSTICLANGYLYVGLNGGGYLGRIAKLQASDGAIVWNVGGLTTPGVVTGEDCWNGGACDGRYLYRNSHSRIGRILAQAVDTGGYVWWSPPTDDAPCTVPCLYAGVLISGNAGHLLGVRIGTGPATSFSRKRASNVATIVTVQEHGLVAGQVVDISGLGGTGYNASDVTIVSVPTTTSFTYSNTGSDEAVTEDAGGRLRIDWPWHGRNRCAYVPGANVGWPA